MENQINYPTQDESIDIKKITLKIIRNWYWFVIAVLITSAIAYFLNRKKLPVYNVSATLIVNEEKKSSVDLLINALDRYSARKIIENEIAIIKSYKMAYKAIIELKPDFQISYYSIGRLKKPMLYKSPPFKVILDTTSLNITDIPIYISIINKDKYRLEIDGQYKINEVRQFGEPFIHDNFHFTIFLNDYANLPSTNQIKYYFTINDINSLVKTYQGKLSVSPNDKKGTVLILSISGQVAAMEADYLNKLMEVYIRSGLEEKNQTATNTISFIDEQLSTVVDSLRKAEDKLQNFRLNNKILDVSSEGNAIMQRLEKVQSEKAKVDVELKYYKYLQKYIEEKKDFREVVAPSIMGIGDPLLNALVSELSSFYGERSVLTRNAQQNYPGLTLINAKIQNSMDALKENIRQIISATNLSLGELNRRLTEIEREIQQLPITERRLLNIQRDFKLNDKIYDFLLQRRADAAIAKASNVADNKVLDQASAQNFVLVSPKTSRNRMIAIALGLLIPLFVLLIIEYFNEKIVEPKDIEHSTKVPIYGSVGHNEKTTDIPVAKNPKSPIAESFRAFRTNLQYVMRNKEQKIICISSTIIGEGKTFCAVNLAAIIAQSNKKTLLMSLDLRKPKTHKVFNINNKKGISTYLIGRSTFEETIVQTNVDNLFLAPSGPVPPNPAELIETPMMEEFIARAKNEFDIIIIDTPPIAIVTDALLLAPFSDAFVFVIRQNYSTKAVLKLVDDLYHKRNMNNIGILLNDIKINSYYGYRQKYSYGYGYYGYGYSNNEAYYGEVVAKPGLVKRIISFLFKN